MRAMLCTASCVLLAAGVARAQGTKPGLPSILPRDLEIELALSAAPPHLRDGAAVYVLGEKAYSLARESRNGFSCFVERHWLGDPAWRDYLAPQCTDREGAETIMRVVFDRVRYFREGLPAHEIQARIGRGFASGAYHPPRRTGVIYMLSPLNKVPDHRNNWRLFDYVPHVMYYAPYVTNDSIGVPEALHTGDEDYVFGGLPYVAVSGPHGFIVQVLGERERAAIVAAHRQLIARLLEYIDFQIRDL